MQSQSILLEPWEEHPKDFLRVFFLLEAEDEVVRIPYQKSPPLHARLDAFHIPAVQDVVQVDITTAGSAYWAELVNFGHKYVHIPDHYVRDYDRMLMGGIWAQVDVRFDYDEDSGGKYPFYIERLTPIQLATFDLEDYRRCRREFTTAEWLDFILRSMGYEPDAMERRLKLLFVSRLIPLCEQNLNLVELGPRGTGKTYAIQELSPYAALLTGPTTVANLFGYMTGKQRGMVEIWDVVGFDEVADLEKMPKEVVTTLKTYCESAQFLRGQEPKSGYSSISMFGNTQQPVEIMVQTGHLFDPMPEIIRNDMAFLDRKWARSSITRRRSVTWTMARAPSISWVCLSKEAET